MKDLTPIFLPIFRPMFLNRVDEIVLFKRLTLEEVENIVELLAHDLSKRLAERQIKIEISNAAWHFIEGLFSAS